jgi:Ca2+:H+ antiporter
MIGSSFFLGGINRIEQSFNISLFTLNLDFHFLMILALGIPTAYHVFTNDGDQESLVRISRGTAILMVSSYCMLLFWCFKTHSPVVEMPNEKNQKNRTRWALRTVYKYLADRWRSCWARHKRSSPNGSIASTTNERGLRGRSSYVDEDVDEVVEPQLSINTVVLTLILSTIFIGFCTTFAVDSIQGLTKNTSLSQMFVGLILLPILGCNIDAIRFAQKDNMDESLDITVGGSIQIMGFILPMAVLIDWGRKDSGMTLLFDDFQVVSVGCLAVLVRYMAQDGKSNWYIHFSES